MLARESMYFLLSLESLRLVGGWAADCAERALSVYENCADSDSWPRAAIEGIRVFAGGGQRTAQLCFLALAAFSAARDAGNPAVAAAARAASLARLALIHIHWRMFNKRNMLSVPQLMPHWHLS
jgi:hypothetical protein